MRYSSWLAIALVASVGGCDTNCVEAPCTSSLVITGVSESGDFVEGEIQIRLEVAGESFDCANQWPEASQQELTCGPAEIRYLQEQVCERLETGFRCVMSGGWTQGFSFRDQQPEAVALRVTFADGSVFEREFTPEYEAADPERVDCTSCPTTELAWDLP